MEKPFIKLFHTPNSGYFYDVGKNEIIRIPENVYQHLSCVIQDSAVLGQSDDKDVLEMINAFKDHGYLSTKRPIRIHHSATDMVPLLLERCIDKITLQLTQDCNFRCKYCVYSEDNNTKQRSHAPRTMSLETAKEAVLFYRDHAVDAYMYNVGFYGGEPLLQWDLMKNVILFAEKELVGKRLTFSITTNASLLTDSVAAFLDEHNVNTTISLDGIREVNDVNRVFRDGRGTFSSVLNNLKMIKRKYPRLYKGLFVSSVVDPAIDIASFGLYPEVLGDLPLNHFIVNIEDSGDHDTQLPIELNCEIEKETIQAFLAEFGLYSHPVKPFGINHVDQLLNRPSGLKSTVGISDIMAPSGPCIPGKSRLMVDINGALFPCERVNETDENCIGSLKYGFDIEKAQRILNVGSISEEMCKNCWALRLCTACIHRIEYANENAASEKQRFCKSIRMVAETKIRGMILAYEFEKYYKKHLKRGNTI